MAAPRSSFLSSTTALCSIRAGGEGLNSTAALRPDAFSKPWGRRAGQGRIGATRSHAQTPPSSLGVSSMARMARTGPWPDRAPWHPAASGPRASRGRSCHLLRIGRMARGRSRSPSPCSEEPATRTASAPCQPPKQRAQSTPDRSLTFRLPSRSGRSRRRRRSSPANTSWPYRTHIDTSWLPDENGISEQVNAGLKKVALLGRKAQRCGIVR